MPKRVTTCIHCERDESEVGRLSRRHVCLECSTQRMLDGAHAMHDMNGEAWKRWNAGMTRFMQRLQSMNVDPPGDVGER